MQQFVSSLQAKCRNQAIYSLTHRVTALPQIPIVLGGCDGQIRSGGLEYMELQQFITDVGKNSAIWNAL